MGLRDNVGMQSTTGTPRTISEGAASYQVVEVTHKCMGPWGGTCEPGSVGAQQCKCMDLCTPPAAPPLPPLAPYPPGLPPSLPAPSLLGTDDSPAAIAMSSSVQLLLALATVVSMVYAQAC